MQKRESLRLMVAFVPMKRGGMSGSHHEGSALAFVPPLRLEYEIHQALMAAIYCTVNFVRQTMNPS